MNIDLDLRTIAHQENELQLPVFDMETAWRLGSRLRSMALIREAPIVIDVRRFGHQLFYTALAGTSADNADWVRRKSNLVARFLKSSYAIGLTLKRDSTTLLDRFGLPATDFAAHGGSFPIFVANAGAIGSITVSGLPQRSDHEFVVEALCGELGQDYATMKLSDPLPDPAR